MHHSGKCRHGKNIARYLDGSLFRLPLYFLDALWMGAGLDVPYIAQNLARSRLQDSRQFAVIIPGFGDRRFVYGALTRTKMRRRIRRNISLRTIQAHIALALLLGIVKGMGVEKRPDELATDVFKPELEMRVLIDGVVAAIVGGRADQRSLLVIDFFRPDQARGVTRPRGRDR